MVGWPRGRSLARFLSLSRSPRVRQSRHSGVLQAIPWEQRLAMAAAAQDEVQAAGALQCSELAQLVRRARAAGTRRLTLARYGTRYHAPTINVRYLLP